MVRPSTGRPSRQRDLLVPPQVVTALDMLMEVSSHTGGKLPTDRMWLVLIILILILKQITEDSSLSMSKQIKDSLICSLQLIFSRLVCLNVKRSVKMAPVCFGDYVLKDLLYSLSPFSLLP